MKQDGCVKDRSDAVMVDPRPGAEREREFTELHRTYVHCCSHAELQNLTLTTAPTQTQTLHLHLHRTHTYVTVRTLLPTC